MNKNIELTDSLFDITTKFPETIEVFAANGFSQLLDESKRKLLGRALTLEVALASKKKNTRLYIEMLEQVISQREELREEGEFIDHLEGSVNIAGVLPCPVKIPLIDGFKAFSKEYYNKNKLGINYRLKSASGGIGWIEDEIKKAKTEDQIPDLFASAGFELFFDKHLIGGFRDKGVFKDLSNLDKFNKCFNGLDLKDPMGNYSILAGVPAIFLVNTEELRGRKKPETWDDILSKEFQGSLSLPVEDLDLFNSVILTLLKNKGEEAIKALGRNLMSSMHPAQMVKTSIKAQSDKPAVTVLPWFFTKMVFPGTPLEVVWPRDGAILSPIFIASKKSKEKELREIVKFFEGETVAKILRDKGYFPSVNPNVDNRIPKENKFIWLGWDYIYSHDITAQIEFCMAIFNKELK